MLSSQQGRNGDNLWNRSYQISWYAPNFINMCIDNIDDGELSGRIYHCYSKEPWKFTNILQLIELADDFFDKLEFPQASTSARSFTSTQFSGVDRLDKVQAPEDFNCYVLCTLAISKTFVIRSFFFEKWLLTHVFGGSRGQKSSCKQACIGFLTF